MNWVTIIWSMVASACLMLAAIHFLVWYQKRTTWAHLFFFLVAVSTAAFAGCELWMMRAATPGEFGTALRWVHVPVFALIVGLVGFVQTYLGAGRRWLAWTTCAVRAFSLLLNFLIEPNVNYREITRVWHIPFLGDSVSVCEGVPSLWNLVGHLSLLLLVCFVVDAGITVWRRGERRRAVVVGGSIVFFVLAATVQTILVRWGVIHWPETACLFFLGIVLAMSYEMSRDMYRAAQLSEDLLESGEHLRQAAVAAEFGAYQHDFTTGDTFHSTEYLSIYGLSNDAAFELDSDRVPKAVHPDDKAHFLDQVRAANDPHGSGILDMEYRILCHDGQVRWIRMRGRTSFKGQGPDSHPLRANGIIQDITRHKLHEEALRESETRLSLTTDAVDAGLWIMDVDMKKVWVSPKTRVLFNFAPDDEIYYKNFFDVIHPEDRDRVNQDVQRTIQSGETLQCDYRIVLPDGNIRWIFSRGQRYLKGTGERDCLMGLSLDITERKQMEMQLSESQTLLSALINSTSDLIWSVDPEHLGLVAFNRGLSEYFLHGAGLHIKAGMTPEVMLPKEFAQQWHMLYRRALEEGSFITDYQTSTQGRVLRLNLNILKRDDVVFGISVFAQDFTSRKKLEEQLGQSLEEVQGLRDQLQMENRYLREQIKRDDGHAAIVGDSKSLLNMLADAKKVAPTDSTVLLLGETGTGKELLAHAIHEMSNRKERALVIVNCASLPPTLIESELFGREKGAYTGSLTKMVGRFELADGSTLFLDEIGDLPLELQSKLLRVLEQGQFERLGSTKTIRVNVRVIAATNRDLAKDVEEGKFRSDLYYRLNVFPVTIPPLRDRKEDIPSLVWSFVKLFEKSLGKRIDSIPKKQMESLTLYNWPGNIRELKNVIERAMILSNSTILYIEDPVSAHPEKSGSHCMADIERRHILDVLEKTGWRISGKNGAAEILGIKRTTLQSKMKTLGITRNVS